MATSKGVTPTPTATASEPQAPVTPIPSVPAIYKALDAINESLITIQKENSSTQGYKFRGIDDVINHLGPLMKEHHVITLRKNIQERVESGTITRNIKGTENYFEEGKTKTRPTVTTETKPITSAVVKFELHFVSTLDKSREFTECVGHGQDAAASDKAMGMAQSNAYKYGIIQMFTILTKDTVDSDMRDKKKKDVQQGPAPLTPAAVVNTIVDVELTDEQVKGLAAKVVEKGIHEIDAQMKARGARENRNYTFTQAQQQMLKEAHERFLAKQTPAVDDGSPL